MTLSAWFAPLKKAALGLWRLPWLRRTAMAVLLGLSLLFLFLAIRDASASAVLQAADGGDLVGVGIGGIAYGLLLVLLAQSWTLAPALLTPGISCRRAIAVYGSSILPKYIPGSVLQYGSRQYLGSRMGWSGPLMANASLLEVTLHVLCSLTVALVLLSQFAQTSSAQGEFWYIVVIAVAITSAIAALIFIGRRLPARIILASAMYQLAFFAGLAVLAMLCGVLFGVASANLLSVGGLFLLSWLIGFLVPVVPGGLGVREASGVALLSGLVGVETALLILAAMRIISLLGDVLAFLAGLACQRTLGVSDA